MDEAYFLPTIMFNSRSGNSHVGDGPDERIHAADRQGRFRDLQEIPQWRQKLSNFYYNNGKYLFMLDGYCWYSVEHYFHAQKFREYDPKYYLQFTFDSSSSLSMADGATVRRAGRNVKLPVDILARWDSGESADALLRAQSAKFRQNADLRRILCLTSPALLTHRMLPRANLQTEHGLMKLRDELIAEFGA